LGAPVTIKIFAVFIFFTRRDPARFDMTLMLISDDAIE
jgi:hypothetical protein